MHNLHMDIRKFHPRQEATVIRLHRLAILSVLLVLVALTTTAWGQGYLLKWPCVWFGSYAKCVSQNGLMVPDGAVGAPSVTFTGDTDNGLYRIGANNPALAAGGTTVIDMKSTGVSILGTTTNDDAPAGRYGRYLENKKAGQSVGTGAQYWNAATLTLDAGDWDVEGMIVYDRNGATWLTSYAEVAINTVTDDSASGTTTGQNKAFFSSPAQHDYVSLTLASVRVQSNGTDLFILGSTLSSTQVIYLKGYVSAYSVATPKYSAILRAREVR